MSILTESLECIFEWLQQNKPSIISSLEPGLSEFEIRDRLEQDFPFLLPVEFYELYQWRNGTVYGEEDFTNFFPGCMFHSLEYALEIYSRQLETSKGFAELNNVADPECIFSRKWLPIFTTSSEEYLCILGNEEVLLESPILTVFGGAIVEYTSLTGMMQAIAECYTTGVYYLDEEGILMEDHVISKQIQMKYNEGVSFY